MLNATLAATHPLTVDALCMQSDYIERTQSTHDPRTYLAELFSSDTLAIHRRDIKVRSDRLIDEYAARHSYAKRFNMTTTYYIRLDCTMPLPPPKPSAKHATPSTRRNRLQAAQARQAWLQHLQTVDEMSRSEVQDKFGIQNPTAAIDSINEIAGRNVIAARYRCHNGKMCVYYRYIGGNS